jgi:hypothetical protein
MIPAGSYLIGDAGYPGEVGILIPYPSIATPENERFNFIHSSTRMVVEQAFGRLKNRFRILLTAQKSSPVRARNNTFACVILHNILNRRGTLYLQGWNDRTPDEQLYNEINNGNAAGMDEVTTHASNHETMRVIRNRIWDELCL